MYVSKDDLLAGCLAEMPVKDFTLSNGKTVKIRALKGSTKAKLIDMAFDERLQTALSEGLVEPRLLPKEIRQLIDYDSDKSLEIYNEIMDFSSKYSEAEKTEKETAEKN